jgi:hypothetical protein
VSTTNQPRNKRNGKYTFAQLDALCACGHPLGQHTAEAPHECIAGDFGHGPCNCEKFKKVAR